MRFLRTDETIREGTPARGRPRPHSLDACPRRSFILSRGTDGTGRGLGRGSELRAAARGKRHGMREMIELQQVHRRYAMSGQTVHALAGVDLRIDRSEEHKSELPSLMRTSYAVFCLKKKNKTNN